MAAVLGLALAVVRTKRKTIKGTKFQKKDSTLIADNVLSVNNPPYKWFWLEKTSEIPLATDAPTV